MSSSGGPEETEDQDLSEEGCISQTMSLSSQPSHHSSKRFLNPNTSACFYGCIATLKGNSSYVSSLAVDGCGSLYIASSDGHISLWPLDTASEVKGNHQSTFIIAVTGSSIKCVVTTSKGLVKAHQDGKIRVWHHHAGHRRDGTLRRLALRAVLPTAADRLRAFLLPENYVEIRRHRRRTTWVHHVDAVAAVALSPDGAEMYSVSWDRSLKAWRLGSGRCVASVAAAHDDAINAVAVSPADGGRVYTGSADGTVKAWRLRHQAGQRKLFELAGTMERHKAAVNALAIGAGGQVLYSGSCDKTVVVWACAGGVAAATATLKGHTKAVLCLAAAGDVVCSGSADMTVRVWRRGAAAPPTGSYACLAVLRGHAGPVKSLALVSETGNGHDGSGDECCSAALVCSGSLDCRVKIWRVNVSCL